MLPSRGFAPLHCWRLVIAVTATSSVSAPYSLLLWGEGLGRARPWISSCTIGHGCHCTVVWSVTPHWQTFQVMCFRFSIFTVTGNFPWFMKIIFFWISGLVLFFSYVSLLTLAKSEYIDVFQGLLDDFDDFNLRLIGLPGNVGHKLFFSYFSICEFHLWATSITYASKYFCLCISPFLLLPP